MKSKFPFARLAGLAAALLLAAPVQAMDIPDEYKTGGFAVGTQAYTFRLFSVLEAIDKTAEAGGRIIEVYPGQTFRPGDAETRWDHHATDEMIAEVEARLEKRGVLAVNYGVVGIPRDKEEARKIFDFAKRLGLRAITTNSTDSLDTIEELVREYDISVAFHNHPRRADRPQYNLWDPAWLHDLIRDRDSRIGASADTGHWIRSGVDPVEALRLLRGRVISLHLKDRLTPEGDDVVFGEGHHIPGILDELRIQGFSGHISVEYEANWENNVADVARCIGFITGYGQARGWE